METKRPTCDMHKECLSPVTMLDNRGFIYCAAHGLQRRAGGTPCRKLTASEIRRIERGETIGSY